MFCFLSLCLSLFAKEDHWDGEQYLKNSELQFQWATSYIEKLHLRGDEKILDIGCGDGRITALLARAVPQGKVVGIDISESMLQTAQKLSEKVRLSNLSFMKRDAMQLNFEQEFDVIVSFCCLHWISDHFATLQGIENALKPGGRVFLYFAPDHGRDRFDHAIHSVVNAQKWNSYFKNFSNPFSLITPAQFATYTENVHLLLKRIEIITVDEPFSNRETFMAWMRGWMSYLRYLPKERQEEFLEEIIACYLQTHPIDLEGKLHYVDYFMEVELLKAS